MKAAESVIPIERNRDIRDDFIVTLKKYNDNLHTHLNMVIETNCKLADANAKLIESNMKLVESTEKLVDGNIKLIDAQVLLVAKLNNTILKQEGIR